MPDPQTHIYAFGDFRLDAARRLLLGQDGTPLPLTPKAFETLLYLVERVGAVLSKDELMRAIWPDTAVEENNLNQNISTLRRALGESRGERRYIVTVPGRGYRFVAEVRALADTGRRAAAEGTSIAVLPFVNMSAEQDNEYFCDGLAEELINALSKLEQLHVVARTSAFAFKGRESDVREIGRKLNVSTVVEGSVRKSGNRLRITVQLINAADGYHLWSERYDRELEMKDIFDVQDEITLAVVDALKVKLPGKERAAALKHHTNNPEAYLLYLKGLYYRWKTAPEEFRKCRDYYQRAVEVDPSFALGYFGLDSYYGYGAAWGILSPDEGWPQAEAAIAKTLALDDTLPEVHLARAAHKLVYHREWGEAARGIERIARQHPKYDEIHHLYSFYLLTVGRFEEAIAESRRALECDPLSLSYSRFLGVCFYFARRYDEAVAQYREALELDPNNAAVHESLGDAFEQQGLCDAAVAAWQRAMTLAGDDELAAILSRAYAAGDFASAVRAVAQERLERMRARADRGEYVPAVDYARAYLRCGDEAQAFHWLEQACAERNVYPLLMNSDPFYDSLRPDPRFAALVRRVGLPD